MVLSIHCPPPESIPKTREVRGICGIVGFLSTNSFTYDVKLGILTVLRVLRGIVGSVMSWRWVWLEASVSVIFPRFQKRMQMIRLDCRRPRLISLPHTAPCQRAQRGINVLYIMLFIYGPSLSAKTLQCAWCTLRAARSADQGAHQHTARRNEKNIIFYTAKYTAIIGPISLKR